MASALQLTRKVERACELGMHDTTSAMLRLRSAVRCRSRGLCDLLEVDKRDADWLREDIANVRKALAEKDTMIPAKPDNATGVPLVRLRGTVNGTTIGHDAWHPVMQIDVVDSHPLAVPFRLLTNCITFEGFKKGVERVAKGIERDLNALEAKINRLSPPSA